MYVQKSVTTTGTPALKLLGAGQSFDLYGVIATYAESSTYYVKFWYAVGQNAATIPAIGTTAPSFTVPITSAGPGFICSKPINMFGPVYWAVTANAADNDDTALGTGGDVINLLLE